MGLEGFPAKPENKRPLIEYWKNSASNDKTTINDLLVRILNGMVVAPKGPTNGKTIIDFNIRES